MLPKARGTAANCFGVNYMKKRIAEVIAQKLSVPLDAVSNDPMVEIIGSSQVKIDRHKGILTYRDDAIEVRTGLGIVAVQGSGLCVAQMNRRRILLRGKIDSVRLV